MSKTFKIAANGTTMGFYKGVDADTARDAYAKDAGYSSFAELTSSQQGGTIEDDVVVEEWKTERHIMLTVRHSDWSEITEDRPSSDGIVSQEDYECTDEAARQAVVDKLVAEAKEFLRSPGTRAGDYRVMVIDYTDDENGEDLVDIEETVDGDEDLDDAA